MKAYGEESEFIAQSYAKFTEYHKNPPAVMGEGVATLEMKWSAKSNKTKSGQF